MSGALLAPTSPGTVRVWCPTGQALRWFLWIQLLQWMKLDEFTHEIPIGNSPLIQTDFSLFPHMSTGNLMQLALKEERR